MTVACIEALCWVSRPTIRVGTVGDAQVVMCVTSMLMVMVMKRSTYLNTSAHDIAVINVAVIIAHGTRLISCNSLICMVTSGRTSPSFSANNRIV